MIDIRHQFYPHCGQGDQQKDDKYSAYGPHSMRDDQNQNYLSPTFGPPGTIVRLQPDETLMDRFEIKSQLGKGRSGVVYLAEDTLRSTEVALKVVEVGPINYELVPQQFKHEINANNKIPDHQYIIRVYDLHFVPQGGTGLMALTMEFADGGSFRKWLSEHSDDLETRRTIGLDYFKQACHGLAMAHDANVMHFGLKPENLLLIDNILKVSDFGSFRCAQLSDQSSNSFWEMPLLDKKTFYYMSPEHFIAPHPDDLGPGADIYSLGIILYELLHPQCRPPFGGSYVKLREFHLKMPVPKLPGSGESLAGIVARCLEKDPDDRYQNIWELLEDLEKGRCSSIDPTIPEDLRTQVPAEFEDNWEMASLCFSHGDFNEAARLTDKVLSAEPEHAQAWRLRAELQSKYDQAELFYQDIARNLETGDLYDLTGFLQEAVHIYPEHPSGGLVQAKLAAKANKYRKIMEQGLLELHKEHWESALDLFQQAIQLHKGASQLRQIIELLTKLKDMRQNINQAVGQKDFDKALLLARSVDCQVEEMKARIPALKGNVEAGDE